jgi:hypothetical protein
MQNQVRAAAHNQARNGNELEAVEGAGAVEFGEIHGGRELKIMT